MPLSGTDSSTSTCPERAVLRALASGRLDEATAARLDEHIGDCVDCEWVLSDLEAELEGESDTLLRLLAVTPSTMEDEPEFQQGVASLQQHPERFGSEVSATSTLTVTSGSMPFVAPLCLGNYELLEQIGAGAHGAVFRARHLKLQKTVAVKLLLRDGMEAVREFQHEMQVVGQLDHPHIVRATDAGEAQGIHFLVMDYVPGMDVSTLSRRQGTLRVADVCEILRQAALGLEFAHRHQLVHRDVKGSNLLFTASGQVKLLDLGLATAIADAPIGSHGVASPRGTPDYMAPEQWNDPSAVDGRTDLYSLGCTCFRLLVGEPPFRHQAWDQSHDVAGITLIHAKRRAHCESPAPSLKAHRGDVPLGLDRLVTQLLAKRPQDRPASAEIVARELRRYASESDLTRLAKDVFGDAYQPLSTDATSWGASELSPTPTVQTPARRRVLLELMCLTGLATLGGRYFWHRSPRLEIDHDWRTIVPTSPATLRLPRHSAAQLTTKSDQRFVLDSNQDGCVNFGRPLRYPLTLRAVCRRENWETPAGVYFGLRTVKPDSDHAAPLEPPADSEPLAEDLDVVLQTVAMSRWPSDRSGATWILQWISHRWSSHAEEQSTLLAEAKLVLPPTKSDASGEKDDDEVRRNLAEVATTQEMEITLGHSSVPEVVIDGQPVSTWEFSQEGRDQSQVAHGQLLINLTGRFGLWHRSGSTEFLQTQLKYLPASY